MLESRMKEGKGRKRKEEERNCGREDVSLVTEGCGPGQSEVGIMHPNVSHW